MTVSREWPIGNQVKFRLGRAIAIWGDVVAYILDAVGEEFTFLELEGYTVFHENIADAFEQAKQGLEDGSPQEDVVDNDAAAKVRGVGRVAGAVESLPLFFEDAHHTGVKARCITRSKRHNRKAVFVVVWGEKSEFLLILGAYTDLVISGFVVESNKEEAAGGITEIIDSIVAAGNWVFEWQSGLVQSAVGDAEAPNKVGDVDDVFLMWFCSKDNRRSSRFEAFVDPAVGL